MNGIQLAGALLLLVSGLMLVAYMMYANNWISRIWKEAIVFGLSLLQIAFTTTVAFLLKPKGLVIVIVYFALAVTLNFLLRRLLSNTICRHMPK